MVGSVLWNSNDFLKQFLRIFKSKKRSSYASSFWEKLIKLGLSTNKNELYKYVYIKDFLLKSFTIIENKDITSEVVSMFALKINSIRLVFIDGHLKKFLSVKNTYPFVIKTIKNNQKNQLPKPINPDFFLYLNESLAEEIYTINLSKGINNKVPLYLLYISSGQENCINTINYRTHISLKNNTTTEIIEHYVSLNNIQHFTSNRNTFHISDNVNLNYNKIVLENNQSYHFSYNEMLIKKNSVVKINNLFLGANVLKNNNNFKLNGNDSFIKINSLTLPTNKSFYDNNSYLEHNNKNCFSRQTHKSILLDKSVSIFNGMLKVSKYAENTDGHMINKNLLLNPLAKTYSNPQLEINNDNVKCKHSATVGYLNEDQIFYLQSRGIDKIFAKNILIQAFTLEIISKITNVQFCKLAKLYILKRISGVLKKHDF